MPQNMNGVSRLDMIKGSRPQRAFCFSCCARSETLFTCVAFSKVESRTGWSCPYSGRINGRRR